MIFKEETIIKTATFLPSTSLCLIGFMGSGKSTFAQKLHSILGFPIYATDTMIEAQCQKSIQEIFSTQGEGFFRTKEEEVFYLLLHHQGLKIIDCGGGFCLSLRLERLGKVVFLDVGFQEILQRMNTEERYKRPLFDSNVEELYLSRRELYLKQAQIVWNPNKEIEEFLEELRRRA